MKYLYLKLALALCVAVVPFDAMAQQKTTSTPIFVTPYKPTVPTYASNVPSVVKSTGQSRYSQATRTYTKPNRLSGPVYDEVYNPFAADYGRMRAEKDFYDVETGGYVNQYEYFALLARRGDTAKLKAAVTEVQTTGVFDPAKYQAAMAGNVGGGQTQTTQTPQQLSNTPQNRAVVQRQNTVTTPKRVHAGYDDPPVATTPKAQPRKNAPIFLR